MLRAIRGRTGSVCAAALTPAAVVLVAPAGAQGACPNTDVVPTGTNLKVARTATLCLLNAERRERGLRPLRQHPQLRSAATGFSRRMVRERFFDHVSPDGSTLTKRVAKAGYSGWRAIAENIAWGSGPLASPSRVVAGWMGSTTHRHNILDGNLREIGIGIVPGAPMNGAGGRAATYTTDFGRRR